MNIVIFTRCVGDNHLAGPVPRVGMVDFQSRDTRRGPTIDDSDDESESESDTASNDDAAGTADTADTASNDDAAGTADTADTASNDDAAGAADAADTASNDDASGTADTADAAEGDGPDADTDAAVTDHPLATDADSADADTADDDPLAVASSTTTETADERADTEESVPAADTEKPIPEADTEESVPAADTEEPVPAADATKAVTDDGSEQAETEATSPASKTATPARSIDVAVVTVAGDRAALEETVTTAFESAGHTVVRCERPGNGYDSIQQQVDALVDGSAVDVVVTVGGVGLAADELAIEAVHPLLEKALPGFGEAFRDRLADHIGTGIVGVRSTAGLCDGTFVFCLPGDAEAAELAVSEILAVEAPRLVSELES